MTELVNILAVGLLLGELTPQSGEVRQGTNLEVAYSDQMRSILDETKTARGLECLQNYRREVNDKLGEPRATPVHDWASHGADAFRYLAVSIDKTGARPKLEPLRYTTAGIV